MKFESVASQIVNIPHTTPDKGKVLYDTIISRSYKKCLELGFACGVGSSYMAAALDEIDGHLISVDLPAALDRKPRADHLIEAIGLSDRVTFKFEELGYTWWLMDAIARNDRFDFVFLDGAHTWDVDGFAYFLVERLLSPGGMIIFDDLDWTIARSPTLKNKPFPERVRQTAAIRKIYELLVKTTPGIKAYERDGWAFAEKPLGHTGG